MEKFNSNLRYNLNIIKSKERNLIIIYLNLKWVLNYLKNLRWFFKIFKRKTKIIVSN